VLLLFVITIFSFIMTVVAMPWLIRELRVRGVLVRDYYKRKKTYIPREGGMVLLFACGLMITIFPLIIYFTRRVMNFFDFTLISDPNLVEFNYFIVLVILMFEDELQMIKECLIKYLSSNHYDHIVIHLPGQLGRSIEDCLKDTDLIKHRSVQKESNLDAMVTQEVIRTCTNSATDKNSLNRLTKELKQLVEQYSNAGKTTRVSNKRRYQMILEGIARYQFGQVGKKLVEDCNVKGKYPYLRLLKDNVQVGMLTGERGMISLTLDGARLLVAEPDFEYKVEIDDFVPKGSIMAIGILEANPAIRVGDDVVACHNKELRAVGQAVMCGIEMENSNRGQGIKVRHHI